jgi:hypothetical protein
MVIMSSFGTECIYLFQGTVCHLGIRLRGGKKTTERLQTSARKIDNPSVNWEFNVVPIYCKPALFMVHTALGRLCGLVVRVIGYRSGGPGSIPGTTIKK